MEAKKLTEVKSLTIVISGKEIVITLEEARSLQAALDGLLGASKTQVIYVDKTGPAPIVPTWIPPWNQNVPYPQPWQTWCCSH